MTWLTGLILTTAFALPPIPAAREAVNSTSALFGPQHPATAMALRNLALAYEQEGFHNRAEAAAQSALAILESNFGPSDVSLTPALNVLTEIYAAQGRYLEARPFAIRAVGIGSGAELHYATALHNLAAVLEAEGKLNQARDFYARALSARQELLSPDHPYVETTRAALDRLNRGVHTFTPVTRLKFK
jgi:tetratricopeptide (TPR) repeat protein